MSDTWQPIKSRLQNEILTASIAQEIEENGNTNRRQKRRGEQGERRKGEEGRSLTSTFKVTRRSLFGGYHPTFKLSGISTFTFIVSLTHRMDNI